MKHNSDIQDVPDFWLDFVAGGFVDNADTYGSNPTSHAWQGGDVIITYDPGIGRIIAPV